jgi:hypothetical protein
VLDVPRKRSCGNGRKVKREDVERLTLEALKRELIKPAVIAEYVKTYNAERARLQKTASSDRARLERRQGEIARELSRAIDAIVKAGIDPQTLAPQIRALEAERAEITDCLRPVATTPRSYRCTRPRSRATAPMSSASSGLLQRTPVARPTACSRRCAG